MFDFLKFDALLSVIKFTGLYIALASFPLLLFFLYKRHNRPTGEIGLLDECIRHGGTLTQDQCQQVYRLILDVRAAIDHFRHPDGNNLPGRIGLTEAITLLPLLTEIGQPHTCCQQPFNTGQPQIIRYHNCKQTIHHFIEELGWDTSTPLIAEELARITQTRSKIESALFRRKIRGWIFMIGCGIACFLLTNSILTNTASAMLPDETQMEIGLAFYLGASLLFFSRYDYYYSQLYKRYNKRLRKAKKIAKFKQEP